MSSNMSDRSAHTGEDFSRTYSQRFGGVDDYRKAVWSVLIKHFFQQFPSKDGAVLDLGCG